MYFATECSASKNILVRNPLPRSSGEGRGGRADAKSRLREVRMWWRDQCDEEASGWTIEDTEVEEREVSLVEMESCMLESLDSYANDAVCLIGGSKGFRGVRGVVCADLS